MTQLLMTIPNRCSRALHRPTARSRTSRIADVIDQIEANPAAPWSSADLAVSAGINERALQAGFREVIGMSPTTYVRNVRLDSVHQELLAGTPDSVTAVAGRWGFYHQGRFAQQYRSRFGELPSATARRST